MSRFDASHEAHGSTVRQARAIVAGQPAVFTVTVGMSCVAVLLAIACLAIGQAVRAQAVLAMERTEATVFLSAETTRSDAEALRGRLDAMPAVSSAALRTREDALATLVRDGLPPLGTRANPLPDAWVVTLRAPAVGDPATPLSRSVESARAALAELPGVAAVEVDARWVDAVDRWSGKASKAVDWINRAVFAGLIAFLFGSSFLAGRGYSGRMAGADLPGVRVLATVGAFSGIVVVLVAAASIWAITASLLAAGSALQPILDQMTHTSGLMAIGVGAAAILVPICGAAVGQSGHSQNASIPGDRGN